MVLEAVTETTFERVSNPGVVFWSVPPLKLNVPLDRPPLVPVVLANCNVPVLIAVPPVKVLLPERLQVPPPVFVIAMTPPPVVSAITPLKALFPVLVPPKVSVLADALPPETRSVLMTQIFADAVPLLLIRARLAPELPVVRNSILRLLNVSGLTSPVRVMLFPALFVPPP